MLPHLELEAVHGGRLVQSEHLVTNLLEYEIGLEDLVWVHEHDVACRVVPHLRVHVMRAAPLCLNHTVKDSTVQQVIHVKCVQVPEDIVAFVVGHAKELVRLFGFDVDIENRNESVAHFLLEAIRRWLRIAKSAGDLVN
jgi:hypothetical protein